MFCYARHIEEISCWLNLKCLQATRVEMGRKPCCDKVGLKKGPWKSEEDQKLVSFITKNGLGCWRAVPKLAGATLPTAESRSPSSVVCQ